MTKQILAFLFCFLRDKISQHKNVIKNFMASKTYGRQGGVEETLKETLKETQTLKETHAVSASQGCIMSSRTYGRQE